MSTITATIGSYGMFLFKNLGERLDLTDRSSVGLITQYFLFGYPPNFNVDQKRAIV